MPSILHALHMKKQSKTATNAKKLRPAPLILGGWLFIWTLPDYLEIQQRRQDSR